MAGGSAMIISELFAGHSRIPRVPDSFIPKTSTGKT